MQNFSSSPLSLFASVFNNFNLIQKLVIREVIGRYRGSFFGILWSLFNPLLMLAVYTFVFSIVFKARWGGGSESQMEFALVLFSGLMVFNLFADCVSRSPTLIVGNVNYVKKVIFPLEILPMVTFGSAVFHLIISLAVWGAAYYAVFGLPPATAVYFPLVLLPFMLFTLGITWLLSSLGVYLRDISQFIGILVTTLMFLTPIFYPISILPPEYQNYLLMNPLTFVIEQTRDVLVWGKGIDWYNWSFYMLGAMFINWMGFAWFQRTRKGFADVI